MSMSVLVGCVEFVHRASGCLRLPILAGHPLLLAENQSVVVLEEDGFTALLLDHRADSDAAAYVEYWKPSSQAEAKVDALLVTVEAQLCGAEPVEVRGLCEVLTHLDAALAQEWPVRAPAPG